MIRIIDLISSDGCGRTALTRLYRALDQSGLAYETQYVWERDSEDFFVAAGLADHQYIHRILKEKEISLCGEESFAILKMDFLGIKGLLLCGGGHRGLMYALDEAADALESDGMEALSGMEEKTEKPDLMIRGTDRFLMSDRDDDWFFSEKFWQVHMEKLGRARFNRFTLIVGFDTAYMSPPYAFFLTVPGFESIRTIPRYENRKDRALHILRIIGQLCHQNGLEFIFSTWQQLPWTQNQKSLVEGLPKEDQAFTEYCTKGIRQLLEECPEIDGVQFRVNLEAGITASGATTKKEGFSGQTHNRFWFDMIDAVASVKRHLKIDVRAKGMTDVLLSHAMKSGLESLVATKYWCEHMPEPYQMTRLRTEEWRHLNNENSTRRYSYDNLLEKPHIYGMLYRLWNYGSVNLFFWGDPDYVYRFAESCADFHGLGFTISEPLSLKGGHALIPIEPYPIHIHPDMRWYEWEDDRYWLYYLLFGRIGYSRSAADSVWKKQFEKRFGNAATYVLSACEAASRVMPYITTVHFPVHPSMHYWPEIYSGAALFAENNDEPYFRDVDYAGALPSDEQLFCSIRNYVEAILLGRHPDQYSPAFVREQYLQIADRLEKALAGAEENGADVCREWIGLKVDFTMILWIARYHAHMIPAAYFLEMYKHTRQPVYLLRSRDAMKEALACWTKTADLGDQYYAHDLEFDAGTSTRRNGNWRVRQKNQVEKDLASLEKMIGNLPAISKDTVDDPFQGIDSSFCSMDCEVEIPSAAEQGKAVPVSLSGTAAACLKEVTLYYRHTNHRETWLSCPMKKSGTAWKAAVPEDYVDGKWDLILYVVCKDVNGNTQILPGLRNARYPYPYFFLRSQSAFSQC